MLLKTYAKQQLNIGLLFSFKMYVVCTIYGVESVECFCLWPWYFVFMYIIIFLL